MTAQPHILFLFTDQQRFGTIAALGNPIIKTPALDRLVHEGAPNLQASIDALGPDYTRPVTAPDDICYQLIHHTMNYEQ